MNNSPPRKTAVRGRNETQSMVAMSKPESAGNMPVGSVEEISDPE